MFRSSIVGCPPRPVEDGGEAHALGPGLPTLGILQLSLNLVLGVTPPPHPRRRKCCVRDSCWCSEVRNEALDAAKTRASNEGSRRYYEFYYHGEGP